MTRLIYSLRAIEYINRKFFVQLVYEYMSIYEYMS